MEKQVLTAITMVVSDRSKKFVPLNLFKFFLLNPLMVSHNYLYKTAHIK